MKSGKRIFIVLLALHAAYVWHSVNPCFGQAKPPEKPAPAPEKSVDGLSGVILTIGKNGGMLSMGSKKGIREGLELASHRKGVRIIHPVTGRLFGHKVVTTSRLKVTEVMEDLAFAKITSSAPGQEGPLLGDVFVVDTGGKYKFGPMLIPSQITVVHKNDFSRGWGVGGSPRSSGTIFLKDGALFFKNRIAGQLNLAPTWMSSPMEIDFDMWCRPDTALHFDVIHWD